jgi:hypothetical protein
MRLVTVLMLLLHWRWSVYKQGLSCQFYFFLTLLFHLVGTCLHVILKLTAVPSEIFPNQLQTDNHKVVANVTKILTSAKLQQHIIAGGHTISDEQSFKLQ